MSSRKQGEDKSRHKSSSSIGSSGDGKVSGHKGGGSGPSSRHSSQTSLESKSVGPDGGSRGAKPGSSQKTEQSHSTVHGGTSKTATTTAQPAHSSRSSLKGGHKLTLKDVSEKGVASEAGEGRRPHGHPPAEKKKPLTKAERRSLQEAQRKAKAEKKSADGKGATVGGADGAQGDNKHGHTSKSAVGKTHVGEGEGRDEEHGGHSHHQPRTSHGQRVTHPAKITKSASLEKQSHSLKQMQLFSHLPQFERELPPTRALDSTAGSIHPCIIKLGLQYSEGIICGSNARCIALLAAFKKVIQDYYTPPEKELRRDLDATIKPYISFLSRCRPLSVSMGNAIKHLKLKISNIPPDTTEVEAKESLREAIDDYLKDKIHLADKAISQFCQKVINDGDVILVHAHSSIVQRALVDAHKAGRKFRVIVVDSRPKLEGRHCLRQLVRSGIKCSYVFINAVSYIMKEVSKVIVGAHGLLANGYVMSRVGTSLIALVAKSYNVPLLVCCETYKFCDKVQTDSFVINELGDPNDLVPIQRRQGNYLSDWKSIEALRLLNLVYDVTSPDLITMVITQVGLIPCTSVPVVLRISQELEQMQAT